jgi:hypothetical protein
MAAHKPNAKRLALLERRKNVAKRYLRGETQWEIARAFEVNQSTISDDLAAIRKEWLAVTKSDYSERISLELAKIDEIERQAWNAWTKSQENAETLRARMSGDRTDTEKIVRGQAGNPKFLDLVMKCVERRCALLGLDQVPAGTSTVVTVVGGVDLDVILGRKPGLSHENLGAGPN